MNFKDTLQCEQQHVVNNDAFSALWALPGKACRYAGDMNVELDTGDLQTSQEF